MKAIKKIRAASQIFDQIVDEGNQYNEPIYDIWFRNDDDLADAVDEYFREVTDKLQESEAIAVAIVKQYDATMDDKNGCNQNTQKGNNDNTGNQHQNRPLNDDNKLPEGRINGFCLLYTSDAADE